ncbi:MAG: hypothetical protein Q8L13_11760 [Bradyrhizobium sp.]|uniref:hypothetical protein n=1 Tax=Bradyrhizobium sp. TaxID=376 RepID=UPI0027303077|nr:hypothetical protein [Bradyrhizobium sp.]MDP1867001.1 hypothetical protein [Bradyrhizobium sp.]
MSDHDKTVRSAATALQKAIADAHKAGYRVAWPSRPEDLGAIAISETGKVKPAAAQAARPATSTGEAKT